jgi:hypothetical protein
MNMDKMEIIKSLMEDLISEMKMGKGDFDERLGKEPALEVASVEVDPAAAVESEMLGGDEMGEEMESVGMGFDEEDPKEKIKARIEKMRG